MAAPRCDLIRSARGPLPPYQMTSYRGEALLYVRSKRFDKPFYTRELVESSRFQLIGLNLLLCCCSGGCYYVTSFEMFFARFAPDDRLILEGCHLSPPYDYRRGRPPRSRRASTSQTEH